MVRSFDSTSCIVKFFDFYHLPVVLSLFSSLTRLWVDGSLLLLFRKMLLALITLGPVPSAIALATREFAAEKLKLMTILKNTCMFPVIPSSSSVWQLVDEDGTAGRSNDPRTRPRSKRYNVVGGETCRWLNLWSGHHF